MLCNTQDVLYALMGFLRPPWIPPRHAIFLLYDPYELDDQFIHCLFVAFIDQSFEEWSDILWLPSWSNMKEVRKAIRRFGWQRGYGERRDAASAC